MYNDMLAPVYASHRSEVLDTKNRYYSESTNKRHLFLWQNTYNVNRGSLTFKPSSNGEPKPFTDIFRKCIKDKNQSLKSFELPNDLQLVQQLDENVEERDYIRKMDCQLVKSSTLTLVERGLDRHTINKLIQVMNRFL
jgi:hypothetical protein